MDDMIYFWGANYGADGSYEWGPLPVESGEHVGWSNVHRTAYRGDAVAMLLPCSWGDYGGDIVHRANYEVLLERYPDTFITIGNDHDGNGLALRFDSPAWNDVMTDLAGLDDYPLLDDEAMSDIEMRLLDEAVGDWLTMDIQRAVNERVPDRDIDVTADMVYGALRAATEDGSDYPYAETATCIYVPQRLMDAVVDVLTA